MKSTAHGRTIVARSIAAALAALWLAAPPAGAGAASVKAWGSRGSGQLGDGLASFRQYPQALAGMTGITYVAPGMFHALAMDATGKVWGWGNNGHGQIGDGTATNRTVPVEATALAGYAIRSLSAGEDFSLALLNDGTVIAWGNNWYGQLGDGTQISRATPAAVRGLAGIVSVSAAPGHSLALRDDGTVWAWGRNDLRQLGDGTNQNRLEPVQVMADASTPLSNVSAVSAGYANAALTAGRTVLRWPDGANHYPTQVLKSDGSTPLGSIVQVSGGGHYLALDDQGAAWAWGSNDSGQLGTGGDRFGSNLASPVQISGKVAAVEASSYFHSLFLLVDGSLWACGRNMFGQVGDGTTTDAWLPVPVPEMTAVTVAAGGTDFSLALRGGQLYSWGRNDIGQLGDGTSPHQQLPVDVLNVSGPVRLSAGDQHSFALDSRGEVWAWGSNYNGQLGDGTRNNTQFPALLGTLFDVRSIVGGGFHSVAVLNDGSLLGWGNNCCGQAGNGTPMGQMSTTPKALSGVPAASFAAAGYLHSLAVGDGGRVWAWGHNGSGQLGNGTTVASNDPVPVSDPTVPGAQLSGVSAVAAGNNHSAALKDDGTVLSWGANSGGQLGNGTQTTSLVPVQAITGSGSPLVGVTALSSGYNHTVALTSDGSVWAWGWHRYIPPETNGSGFSTTATRVQGIPAAAAVAAGAEFSLVVGRDGSVWAWGDNINGQLGNGTYATGNVPQRVLDAADPTGRLTGVVGIGAGMRHALALISALRVPELTIQPVVSKNRVSGEARIRVVDEKGVPASGVNVSGRWRGLTSDADSGLTGPDGTVVFRSDELRQPTGDFCFSVQQVFLSGSVLDRENSTFEACAGYPPPPPPPPPPPRVEICNDGIDNDGDKKIDCADRDCRGTPFCP